MGVQTESNPIGPITLDNFNFFDKLIMSVKQQNNNQINMKTYNSGFARSQWKKSFGGNKLAWRTTRQAGRSNSFRKFTGRCKN